MQNHPNALVVQLDTVIGYIDGKYSVLNIEIVKYKFQFVILLTSHTSEAVANALLSIFEKMKKIDNELGLQMYSYFSELFLTDNGPEFDSLLNLCNEDPNMHVFYCHTLSSFEKGA